jgi:hypothetical protein
MNNDIVVIHGSNPENDFEVTYDRFESLLKSLKTVNFNCTATVGSETKTCEEWHKILKEEHIKYVEGDIFFPISQVDKNITVFVPHVCNDKHAWGAGFVVPLGKTYPSAKRAYMDWKVDFCLGETDFVTVSDNVVVCNMVAQTLGGDRPLFYNHLSSCLEKVAKRVLSSPVKYKIMCPAFGAGLAGGDWKIIKELINDSWIRRGIDVTVFYLNGTLNLDE